MRQLQADGSISLGELSRPASFLSFFLDPYRSWWIYAILVAPLVESVLVLEDVQSGPGLFFRILLGLLLLGLIPGYSTVQILFPGDKLKLFEQALLSIFLSVMISIASGVILGAGYHFTGLSSVLTLGVYTIVATVLAGYRRYSLLRSTISSSG